MIPPQFPVPKAVLHEALFNGGYIGCQDLHVGSCQSRFPVCFLRTLKTMSKYYLPIHIIPFLLFKRKKLKQRPYEQIKRALKSYVNSLLFACTTTGIVSIVLCYSRRIAGKINGDIGLPLATFLAGPALLFESDGRKRQIALFLVPKVMQILYNIIKRRGINITIPYFTVLAFGISMAILGCFFQNQPSIIHPTYCSAIKQVLNGPV